ncbi:jg5658 [Pararge aegeria aegeria]|uniref:Jg5658 protein n=1 Tax=Pararge aegeria aegeria TaxID=348720 RepID=A0A8S4QS91_9NEOP|nr:jg5658 [Pararge aegeria aegeria]
MLKSHFNLQNKTEPEQDQFLETSETEEAQDKQDAQDALEGEGLSEEEVTEQKVVYPERRLNRSEATCTGMSLTNISAIRSFQHLQFVNFSNNNLDLESLQDVTALPFLVLIHADKNVLYSAALKKMKYMQVIIMNNNFLTSVHDVYQPELCTLEVGYNKIKEISFANKMPHIKCLDFRYNLIQEIHDIDFPNLDSLYLAGNKITSLVGIERLVNLRILHVRYNPIKLLNGFDAGLKKLQYINLRNCKVATLKQVKKLRVLPGLETLILKGCPYMGGTGEEDDEVGVEEEDTDLRVEVLASLPKLKRINKGACTPEERSEAKELIKQWIEEGENDEEEVVEEQELEENSNAD